MEHKLSKKEDEESESYYDFPNELDAGELKQFDDMEFPFEYHHAMERRKKKKLNTKTGMEEDNLP